MSMAYSPAGPVRHRAVSGPEMVLGGPVVVPRWSCGPAVVLSGPAVIGLWFSDVRLSPEDSVNYRRGFGRLIQSGLIEIAYRPRGRGAGVRVVDRGGDVVRGTVDSGDE